MTVSVRPLTGEEVSARFEDMARLRIAVFRAFPYLYDGDMDYERRYLETYAAAPGAFVCGAFDRDDLVGMATASPLSQHKAEFAEPFETRGLDVDDFFYFGESVLLPAYRGQGVGVRFFEGREAEASAGAEEEREVLRVPVGGADEPEGDLGLEEGQLVGARIVTMAGEDGGVIEEREAEARRQGFSNCIFSAVIRPADHPLRPADYAPLDAFWRKRGYERIDGLRTAYAWKDIGEPEETDKPMEYWMRDLTQS